MFRWYQNMLVRYNDVIMGAMASQITSLTIVYSTVLSGADQRKHQSSASMAFAGNSPVTSEFPAQRASNRKMFRFDDVIMHYIKSCYFKGNKHHWPNGTKMWAQILISMTTMMALRELSFFSEMVICHRRYDSGCRAMGNGWIQVEQTM